MAKYRFVHCKFWEDPDMLDYTPEEKYFYLYLLTNPHTNQCGIYEISIKQMAFETGYNRETVKELLNRFEENKNKVKYNSENKEIAIKNWPKYNLQNTGKPILDCIKKELSEIKSLELVKYIKNKVEQNAVKSLYEEKLDDAGTGRGTGRGTSGTQKEKEKEKEKEKQKEKEAKLDVPYQQIKKLYNSICEDLKPIERMTDNRRSHLRQRWREFSDISKFKKVFAQAQNSEFLTGDNDRGWKADFNWLVKNEDNFVKVLEGRYNDSSDPTGRKRKSRFKS